MAVAALWQAGFPNAVCALGSYLNPVQLSELCRAGGPAIYICFDADRHGGGQRAARRLSIQLLHAGVESRRVELPIPCRMRLIGCSEPGFDVLGSATAAAAKPSPPISS